MEHKITVNESAVKNVRKVQIKRFVETHLRDADLSVRAVAASMNVSPRYIHRVFADEDESLMRYILRRRLEECALQLGSRLWHGHTVTETAVDWGFSSMAHFSRSFKEHFGVSPTEFRRRHAAAFNNVS
jgi:AraC-like DNA-binding protein